MCFFTPSVRTFIQANRGTNIQNLVITESKLLIMYAFRILHNISRILSTLVRVIFKCKTMLLLLTKFYVKVLFSSAVWIRIIFKLLHC